MLCFSKNVEQRCPYFLRYVMTFVICVTFARQILDSLETKNSSTLKYILWANPNVKQNRQTHFASYVKIGINLILIFMSNWKSDIFGFYLCHAILNLPCHQYQSLKIHVKLKMLANYNVHIYGNKLHKCSAFWHLWHFCLLTYNADIDSG